MQRDDLPALASLAAVGGPRCCKRNSFLATIEAVKFAREKLGVSMELPEKIQCAFFPENQQCLRKKCRLTLCIRVDSKKKPPAKREICSFRQGVIVLIPLYHALHLVKELHLYQGVHQGAFGGVSSEKIFPSSRISLRRLPLS